MNNQRILDVVLPDRVPRTELVANELEKRLAWRDEDDRSSKAAQPEEITPQVNPLFPRRYESTSGSLF